MRPVMRGFAMLGQIVAGGTEEDFHGLASPLFIL
jgi:hypothetical protein